MESEYFEIEYDPEYEANAVILYGDTHGVIHWDSVEDYWRLNIWSNDSKPQSVTGFRSPVEALKWAEAFAKDVKDNAG